MSLLCVEVLLLSERIHQQGETNSSYEMEMKEMFDGSSSGLQASAKGCHVKAKRWSRYQSLGELWPRTPHSSKPFARYYFVLVSHPATSRSIFGFRLSFTASTLCLVHSLKNFTERSP